MNQPAIAPLPAYPPAPWQTQGGAWIGLFRADRSMPLPHELAPLLNQRWIVVALIRHLAGTLRYNECIVGTYARRGAIPGLYIQYIWVDSVRSMAGGHSIWGLPKQLAAFNWQGTTVQIHDQAGPIVTLNVDPGAALLPRFLLPVPIWGYRDERRVLTLAHASARLGRAGMQLSTWSERFPYRIGATPLLAIAMKPFRLTVPAPLRKLP
jgi:hypothetical protein